MITRADMAESLSLGSGPATKTFVLEAHAPDPVEFLRRFAGPARVEPTADAFLFLLHLDEGTFWSELSLPFSASITQRFNRRPWAPTAV